MYILFDIGGTKMRVAGTSDGKTIGSVVKMDTPSNDFKKGMALFERAAVDISQGGKIEGIAGGIAGPYDKERGCLVNSPNISGWNEKPFKNTLEKMFGTSVYIENDADLAGLGEAVYGAGRGFGIVAYITVSTGVGGGRIVDGEIDRNTFGFEPGHQVIKLGGEKCFGCGGEGDLESLISGTALEKRTGKKPYDIPHSDPVWDELASLLAVGLNNIAVLWSPNVIILGGSMVFKIPGIVTEKVERHFKNTVHIFKELPQIRQAELKDDAGLYGALALAKQKYKNFKK